MEIYIEAKMIFVRVTNLDGYVVAQFVEAPRYKPEGRGSDSLLAYSFRQHYVRVVDSSCNRNEYQEFFLGVKAACESG
jgi:hypothetical protein